MGYWTQTPWVCDCGGKGLGDIVIKPHTAQCEHVPRVREEKE